MILQNYFNTKHINRYKKDIQALNALEMRYNTLQEVKDSSLSRKEKILHSIAIVKRASQKSLNMSHYDVQIMGALALIEGHIAQMKTGEGKTLMCSAAVAVNYVLGLKTHVATANEYLAQRDWQTLKPLYDELGLKSSFNVADMLDKKAAYEADILYSTAQEMGFDYLRDSLVKDINEKIQPQDFSNIMAIIDEADFILIDEARTPLIFSGISNPLGAQFYHTIKEISSNLKGLLEEPEKDFRGDYLTDADFWIDAKTRSSNILESGYAKIEILLVENTLLTGSLYRPENLWLIDEVNNAIKANYLFIKDKQYVIQNNKIVIVDENTGRLSPGRNWSDGLHQAIEAKENVEVNPLTSTLRTISIQNYFRNYGEISGMTGTALICAAEFEEIYNSTVVCVPTNEKMIRVDHADKVFMKASYKYKAIINDIVERHSKGQPILVGTTSVNESEIISNLLHEKSIFHYVINAKNHALEAQIISQAGVPFAVTVATSMAGRGTDIILGGNKEEIIKLKEHQLEIIYSIPTSIIEVNNEPNIIDFVDLITIQNFIHQVQKKDFINSQDLLNIENLKTILQNQIFSLHSTWIKNRQAAKSAGGLCVIGCSRNESRRIDDQIRGRSGRQGDQGESLFYISFEDNWLKVFANSSMFKLLNNKMEEPITSPMVTRSIAKAQKSIESMYFDSRKNTFQYDSVLNESRINFFKIRDSLITNHQIIKNVLIEVIKEKISSIEDSNYIFTKYLKVNEKEDVLSTSLDIILDKKLDSSQRQSHLQALIAHLLDLSSANADKLLLILNAGNIWEKINSIDSDTQLKLILTDAILEYFSLMEDQFWLWFKSQCLEQLDTNWIDYLSVTEEMRISAGFSSLVQKNPLYEYKNSCYQLFKNLIHDFKNTLLNGMMENIIIQT